MPSQSPKLKSRKLPVAITLVIVSMIYVLWQYAGAQQPVEVSGSLAPVSTTTVITPVKKSGIYTDGTYTGTSVNAYYGNVQVEAIIQNSALTDVKFLQSPSDRSTSIRISGGAMPILVQEAIQKQSAPVDSVSGATDISNAFNQSLANALTQARN